MVHLIHFSFRKKRRGKFTLFDRVRSKRGRKSQSYGVPYDVRGSGIDGAMELKGVGEEEEEGKDDDYFEDSAALGKKIILLQCIYSSYECYMDLRT